MGYESKLYIVDKREPEKTEGKRYAQVITMFNMCKFDFGSIFSKETDCYFYADDGNTEIIKDRYDDTLTEANIEDVIQYLEEYKNNQEYYRRVDPLLGLLKGFNPAEWDDLKILHYGY
jgi:hypothetical protein